MVVIAFQNKAFYNFISAALSMASVVIAFQNKAFYNSCVIILSFLIVFLSFLSIKIRD